MMGFSIPAAPAIVPHGRILHLGVPQIAGISQYYTKYEHLLAFGIWRGPRLALLSLSPTRSADGRDLDLQVDMSAVITTLDNADLATGPLGALPEAQIAE
jgi:hypothetical protein